MQPPARQPRRFVGVIHLWQMYLIHICLMAQDRSCPSSGAGTQLPSYLYPPRLNHEVPRNLAKRAASATAAVLISYLDQSTSSNKKNSRPAHLRDSKLSPISVKNRPNSNARNTMKSTVRRPLPTLKILQCKSSYPLFWWYKPRKQKKKLSTLAHLLARTDLLRWDSTF